MKHIHGFLATPPLWTNELFGIEQFQFPKINLDGFQPHKIPENLRLGHQMEHLFKQLIDYDPTYEVLAHNLQLQREGITLGELDFLLRNMQTRQVYHVELTYKFYILDPNIKDPISRAMGPNRKDQFIAKLEKTRDRHFPLIHSPEGRNALAVSNISEENIKQECCFLGQLFVPYYQKELTADPLNHECIAGYWLSLKEFATSDFTSFQFHLLTKQEWIHLPNENVPWKSHVEIIENIITHHLSHRAPMIWINKLDGTYEKCFVVSW